MNFRKLDSPLAIAFLSIAIAMGESLSDVPAIIQEDPPFWQFVLRVFVFQTISAPFSRNDLLYKKLLDAPFYGGPSPEAFNNENTLVSRGDVYRMPDGQWIFCQEGCASCESCEQRNDPTVKWILRRVRRPTSLLNSPKWDLRLTVFPQLDESSRVDDERSYDDGYPTRDDIESEKSLRDSSSATTEQHSQSYRLEQSDSTNEEAYGNVRVDDETKIGGMGHRDDFSVPRTRFTSRERGKRYRIKSARPQENFSETNILTERQRDESTPRLIVGIDKNGEKHLVHVVPIDSPNADRDSFNYRSSYRPGNSARIGRRTHHELSYKKLIDRIMNSLSSHRSFIEKFLFADKLEPENRNGASQFSYLSNADRPNDVDSFERRNFDDYRVDGLTRIDRYPTDNGYRMRERDDQFKHYGDVTRVVNKPNVDYHDHTIDYEPYAVSASDGRQDERSLDPTDMERRRRNSIPKLLASTKELRGFSENHTEIDKPDEKFSPKRQHAENADNREFTDSRNLLKINGTDTSVGTSSEESVTQNIETVQS